MKLRNVLILASSSLIFYANPIEVAANQVETSESQRVQAVETNGLQAQVDTSYTDQTVTFTVTLEGQESVKQVTGQLVATETQLLSFSQIAAGVYQVQLDRTSLNSQDYLLYLTLETDIGQSLTFQPAVVAIENLVASEPAESAETPASDTTGAPSTSTVDNTETQATSQVTNSETSTGTGTALRQARTASVASSTETTNSSVVSAPQARSAVAPQVTQPTGNLAVANQDQAAGTFDVVVSNASSPAGIKAVRIPVWSEVGGQDDIVWYDATKQSNGTYAVNVKASNHKNNEGTYQVHLYYLQNDNSLLGVGTTTAKIEFPKPSGKLTITNQRAGAFDVLVSEISSPYGLQAVKLPVWSAQNDQDDIIWYDAVKQSDGTYKATVKASDHKNSEGTYHVHLYYQQNNGTLKGVAGTSTQVSLPKPSGTMTITNQNARTGSFDILISQITSPNGLQGIKVPVWSDKNGQDDIIWYDAVKQTNGDYKVSVAASNHKNSEGTYHAHLYYIQTNGGTVGIAATSTQVSLPKPAGTISFVNQDKATGAFDILISQVTSLNGLQGIKVPVWSDKNGQDDIVWYDANKQADGSYKVHVEPSQHKLSDGLYHAHLYYVQANGSLAAVAASSTQVTLPKASGTISVQNLNNSTGSFELLISNVASPNGLRAVKVPVWSDKNGQDDIVWYDAVKQANGNYAVTVQASQHKNSDGLYHAHLYYVENSGALKAITGTTAQLNLPKPSGTVNVQNVNQSAGSFDVIVSNIVAPAGLQGVKVPIWSDSNGQDDLIWYNAARQTDGTYRVSVKASQHKSSEGIYHIHTYLVQADGSLAYITSTSTALKSVPTTATASLTFENVNHLDGNFEVVVRNIVANTTVQTLFLPVWSETGGQDDIVWYSMTSMGDGSYRTKISAKDHKYSGGQYTAHLYVEDSYGKKTFVAAETLTLNYEKQRSMTIFIDPGHGGADSGAAYSGVYEKDLALSVSTKLRDSLLRNGYNVIMSRTGDQYVDFKTQRSQMANSSNADLFISIHFNATGAGVTSTKGIETFWYEYDPAYQPQINQAKHNDPTRLAESEILAHKVQGNLIQSTGADNRGVKRETFAVLRETAIPAILVELGFMDNPAELQTVRQDSYQNKLVDGLTKGILEWYKVV